MISSEAKTIGQLVADNPSRAKVFQQFGIDFCCGGGKTVEQACKEKGIEVESVLRKLAELGNKQDDSGENLQTMSLADLAARIVNKYHQPLREDMAQIWTWLTKVMKVHGDNHPEVVRIGAIFSGFKSALEMHMQKEEMILFPLCARLESSNGEVPQFHCGSIDNPIAVMMAEHDEAGSQLAAMREMSSNFTPPADACNTFRVLYDALSKLETEMHQHVHEENNILFPRAAELEKKLSASCSQR